MAEPVPPNRASGHPVPPRAGRLPAAGLARWSFWSPFAGASIFILAVSAGATKAAGHPALMFAVVGFCDFIFAAGLLLGLAALCRPKGEGRRGSLAYAVSGALLNTLLLGFMLWLTGFLMLESRRAARLWEDAADQEARQVAAVVGDGPALEKALEAAASRNFAAALRARQKDYDSAWSALTNPPVLDMTLVKNSADLQARAKAARRLIDTASDLLDFAQTTPDLYRRELQRHKLSPQAREAEWQQFMGQLSAVNPSIIALRRAQVRQGEALLRLLRLLDDNWGNWEYQPAARTFHFQNTKLTADYSLAFKEFETFSDDVRDRIQQLKSRNP